MDEWDAMVKATQKDVDRLAGSTADLSKATGTAAETNKGFAATGEISDRMANKLTGSMSNLVGEVLEEHAATVILTGSLMLVAQAFEFAKKAAEEFGNSKVTQQIEGMEASLQGLKKVITDIPVFGIGLLDFLGMAGEGLGNVAKLGGAVILMYQVYAKQITFAEYQTKLLNLANSEQIALLEQLRGEITDVASATDLLRAANRKNYDDYRAQQQSGYIQYAIQQGAAAGVSPGRALGGDVVAGMSYRINEMKGQSEWFTPATGGHVGNSPAAGVNVQNVSVNVQAGAFLGNRADAIKLGQQLAPVLQRALKRTV